MSKRGNNSHQSWPPIIQSPSKYRNKLQMSTKSWSIEQTPKQTKCYNIPVPVTMTKPWEVSSSPRLSRNNISSTRYNGDLVEPPKDLFLPNENSRAKSNYKVTNPKPNKECRTELHPSKPCYQPSENIQNDGSERSNKIHSSSRSAPALGVGPVGQCLSPPKQPIFRAPKYID